MKPTLHELVDLLTLAEAGFMAIFLTCLLLLLYGLGG
jgi:hypothetical protein